MSGALLSFSMVGGLPGNLGSVQVTKGSSGVLGARQIGFRSGIIGSISPTTDPINSATITNLYWDEGGLIFYLTETGVLLNSGWTTLVINGGASFSRAAATFSNAGPTQWSWAASANPWAGTSNPITVYWK